MRKYLFFGSPGGAAPKRSDKLTVPLPGGEVEGKVVYKEDYATGASALRENGYRPLNGLEVIYARIHTPLPSNRHESLSLLWESITSDSTLLIGRDEHAEARCVVAHAPTYFTEHAADNNGTAKRAQSEFNALLKAVDGSIFYNAGNLHDLANAHQGISSFKQFSEHPLMLPFCGSAVALETYLRSYAHVIGSQSETYQTGIHIHNPHHQVATVDTYLFSFDSCTYGVGAERRLICPVTMIAVSQDIPRLSGKDLEAKLVEEQAPLNP